MKRWLLPSPSPLLTFSPSKGAVNAPRKNSRGGEAQLRIANRSILVGAEITLQLAEMRSEIRETKTEKKVSMARRKTFTFTSDHNFLKLY